MKRVFAFIMAAVMLTVMAVAADFNPGTKIRFGDEAIRLHQVHRHCVATKVHDEILLM